MAKSEYMGRGTKKMEIDGMIENMVVLREVNLLLFFSFFFQVNNDGRHSSLPFKYGLNQEELVSFLYLAFVGYSDVVYFCEA